PGLLPGAWSPGPLLDSSASIVTGGALPRKVVFPAEVLRLVSVLAYGVHFVVALPVLLLVLLVTGHVPGVQVWAVAPLLVVQLLLTAGLALAVSALSVLFRDVRDILGHVLQLWFFATPIIYEA